MCSQWFAAITWIFDVQQTVRFGCTLKSHTENAHWKCTQRCIVHRADRSYKTHILLHIQTAHPNCKCNRALFNGFQLFDNSHIWTLPFFSATTATERTASKLTSLHMNRRRWANIFRYIAQARICTFICEADFSWSHAQGFFLIWFFLT
jgi:hypothetical protein